jgi:hypothetical protein
MKPWTRVMAAYLIGFWQGTQLRQLQDDLGEPWAEPLLCRYWSSLSPGRSAGSRRTPLISPHGESPKSLRHGRSSERSDSTLPCMEIEIGAPLVNMASTVLLDPDCQFPALNHRTGQLLGSSQPNARFKLDLLAGCDWAPTASFLHSRCNKKRTHTPRSTAGEAHPYVS